MNELLAYLFEAILKIGEVFGVIDASPLTHEQSVEAANYMSGQGEFFLAAIIIGLLFRIGSKKPTKVKKG